MIMERNKNEKWKIHRGKNSFQKKNLQNTGIESMRVESSSKVTSLNFELEIKVKLLFFKKKEKRGNQPTLFDSL